MATAAAREDADALPTRLAAGRFPDPPYPGIRPFEEHEWPIFFGRQAIIEELLERLSKPRFVAVIGASGGGKSSLIKAGLFATLKHKHKRLGIRWCTATMRPAGSPMWSLAEALYRTLDPEAVAADQPAPADAVEPYRASLARGGHAIAATLREREFPPEQNLLLLVDQFEELFRYDILGGEAEIRTFLDQLVDVVEEPPEGFYLALTMRSDFLGNCARFPRFADALNRAGYLLRRMRESELEEAIVRPAELLGGEIRPDLLACLVRDAQGEQDHLPLLQHALMWLWVRERQQLAKAGTPDAPVVLDLADYQTVGGMAGALSQHANAIYDALGGATPARQPMLQLATQRLFQALAEVGEHGQVIRRPLRFAHLQAETGVAAEDLIEIIDAFRAPGRSFLMPAYGKPIDEATVIDIGHEALIRQWDKLAGDKGWLQQERADAETWWRLCMRTRVFMQNRRRLLDRDETEELAAFWQRRQPTKAWLLRYSAAPDGTPDRKERVATEADEAPELIRKSRRRAQLVKLGTGIAAGLLILMLLSGVAIGSLYFALRQEKGLRAAADAARIEAEQARDEARALLAALQEEQNARASAEQRADVYQVQANVAQETAAVDRARLLAKQATEAVDREGPTTALLLALEGLADRPGLPYVPQAEAAAYAALAQLREERRFEQLFLAWSADGQRVVSSDPDGAVRVRAPDGIGEPVVLRGHEERIVLSAAFSPDGTRIVTASSDRTARVWNAASGAELLVLRGDEQAVLAAGFSPDGARIVSASADQTVRVWNSVSGAQLLVLRGHEGPVLAAGFSPDGARIVSASSDGTARVWDAASGAEQLVLRSSERVNAAGFSPDGRRIVSGSDDETVRVWDAASGAELLVLSGHEGPVLAAGFSPDGARIVSGSEDRTARVWAADGLGDPVILRGHEAPVYRAGFSADGTRVITVSSDGTSRFWRMRPALERITLGSPSASLSRSLPEQTAVATKGGSVLVRDHRVTVNLEETVEASPRLAFSGDGGLLAQEPVAPTQPTRRLPPQSILWEVAGQQATWQRPAEGIPLAARVVDGRVLALIDTQVALLLRDGESEQGLPLGSPTRPLAAAITADGRRLALIDASGDLSIVDGVPDSMVTSARRVDLPSGTRWTLAFTSDGLNLVGVADDRHVFATDAALTNLKLDRMEGPEQGNRVLAVDADRARVAVEFRTADGASLWLKGTAGENPVLLANARGGAGFADAAFGSKGGRLVAVPRSGPCLLFDLARPDAPIALFGGEADRWEAVAYAPSGDRIAAARADGRVTVWPVLPTTGALVAFAQQALPKVGQDESVALSRSQLCAYRLAPEGECGQTAAQ